MATNKKEVLVSIKTNLDTASAQSTAKELQQIIGKSGISKEAKDAATKYLAEFERAAKAMDAITSKGQIGTADYKSLNQYFKMMRDNYAKISEIAKETLDLEPAALTSLRESINKKVSAGEQEIRQRKVQFKGQARAAVGKGVSFQDAKDELTYLNSYIASLEQEKQKIYNETVGVATKQIEEIVSVDKKANGQKFKNLEDYKRYYETKQKEIARLTKDLENPNLGEEERTNKIAQLNSLTEAQLKRTETLRVINTLEEQEATSQERAAAATAKQTKEIADNTIKRDKLQTVLQETENDIDAITDSVNAQTQAERAQLKVEEDLYNTQKAQAQADIQGFDIGTQQNFGQVASDIGAAGAELAKMKGIQEAVGKGFDNITNRLKGFISGTYLLGQAFNKLKQASQIVTNLDNEITQIAVVTKQTTSEVWDSFQTFNQAAMELSTTTRQYLEGAKIFYQQGLNTVEVMSMVEATTRAAALSGVSFRDASETLTAAINGYNMAATEAGAVTDKFAAVGAASAADFQELSTAMEKVASQAYSSGMSFDSLLGILAKGIETTREAPEAIGTGLKSIIARFQEMKENPMATLEDGVDANRVEKALKSVGVALRDTNGEFRNMDEVFADLGEAWKTMSRNQRAYIATMAAGSRQQSRFMAIMNDYDRTLQLVRTSTNSAGEASAQYVIYEESVGAAQQRLQNSFEQMSTSIMSSEFLRWLYDFSATFLSGLSKINPLVLSLGTAFSVLAGKITFMSSAAKIAQAGDLVSITSMKGLTKVIVERLVGTEALANGMVKQTAAQTALTSATVAYVAIAVAAIAIIVILIKAYNDQKNAVHKLAAEKAKASEEAKTEANNLESLVSRYEELDKKINKTAQEQAEYNDLKKQLGDQLPGMIEDIDAEGNFILKTADALKEEVAMRKENARALEIEAYRAKMASIAKAEWDAELSKGGTGAATSEQVKNVKKGIEDLNKEYQKLYNSQEAMQAYSQKTGSQAYLRSASIFDPSTGFQTTLEAYNENTINKFLEQGRTDTENLKQQLVEAFRTSVQGATDDMIEEYSKSIDILVSSISNLTKIRNLELEKVMTSGLYNIGASMISALEFDGEVISNEYKDMVAGLARSAVQEAKKTDIGKITAESLGMEQADFDKLETAEKISRYAEQIQGNWISSMEELRKDPSFQNALEEMTNLEKAGASQKEMEDAYNKFFAPFLKDNPELSAAVARTFFDPKAFDNRMEIVKKHVEKSTKGVSTIIMNEFGDPQVVPLADALQEQIVSSFEGMKKPLSDSLTSAIETMDEGPAKEAFLRSIPKVFDGGEFQKGIEEELSKLDTTDAVAIKNLTDRIEKQLTEVGNISQENAQKIAEAMIEQTTQTFEGFILTAKKTYEELTKINEAAKKSASGVMELGDALSAMQTFGAQNILAVGDRYIIDAGAIEEQRRQNEKKMYDSLQGSIISLEREKQRLAEINNIANAEEIKNLDLQIAAMDKIAKGISEVTKLEEYRAQNQELMTGVSAINATLDSLKSFGSALDAINAGTVDFFDTVQMIATNPDLIAAIDVQNGKFEISRDKIYEIAEAQRTKTLQAIDGIRKEVQAELDYVLAFHNGTEQQKQDTKAKVLEAIALKNQEKIAQMQADKAQLASTKANIQVTGRLSNAVAILIAKWNEFKTGVKQTPDLIDVEQTIADIDTATANIDKEIGILQDQDLDSVYNAIAEKYGTKGQSLIDTLQNTLGGLNTLYDETQTAPIEKILGEASGSADKASKSVEKLTNSFEKYYNELKKIEQLEGNLDEIQSRIDLRSTGAKEDLALLKEKAGTLNQLISSQEDLNSKRIAELKSMESQLGLYRGFVTIENGLAIVRQQELFMQLQAGLITQERYDAVVQYVQTFNELSSAIDETTSSIIDLQAQQEQMYDELIQNAIDTRQQIYDALVESDQREIDELTQKYDTMKQLEDDYLSAVKKAIDEERAAREDSAKAEDLLQKQRRLAILQRDTSGLYATEAAQLQEQIAKDQQDARDAEVDKQMAALEKQITLQQEQRDTQVKLLEDQKLFREETGYYWDRVDNAIQNGPQAMLDLLTSSQEYQTADPLAQQRQLEQFQSAVDTLNELAQGAGDDRIINQIIKSANAIISNRISEMASQNESQQQKPTGGQGEQQKPTGGTYTVKKGDTLTSIAASRGGLQHIKDLNQWIYQQRKTWDLIYPGDQIKYAQGGYVKHTGPAWVDGTKSSPEAFLNARQTAIFESLRDYLATPTGSNMLGSGNISNSTSIGDIIINLQNATGASPKDIADQVKKELTNIMVTKNTLSIQKVR